MIETAEFAGLKKCAVVTIENVDDGCVVGGAPLSPGEVTDLNRAREYLRDTCKRQALPIAKTLEEALELAMRLLAERCGRGRGMEGEGAATASSTGHAISQEYFC